MYDTYKWKNSICSTYRMFTWRFSTFLKCLPHLVKGPKSGGILLPLACERRSCYWVDFYIKKECLHGVMICGGIDEKFVPPVIEVSGYFHTMIPFKFSCYCTGFLKFAQCFLLRVFDWPRICFWIFSTKNSSRSCRNLTKLWGAVHHLNHVLVYLPTSWQM